MNEKAAELAETMNEKAAELAENARAISEDVILAGNQPWGVRSLATAIGYLAAAFAEIAGETR